MASISFLLTYSWGIESYNYQKYAYLGQLCDTFAIVGDQEIHFDILPLVYSVRVVSKIMPQNGTS